MAQIGINVDGLSEAIGLAILMVYVPVVTACLIATLGIIVALIDARSVVARILGVAACILGLLPLYSIGGWLLEFGNLKDKLLVAFPFMLGGMAILLSFSKRSFGRQP